MLLENRDVVIVEKGVLNIVELIIVVIVENAVKVVVVEVVGVEVIADVTVMIVVGNVVDDIVVSVAAVFKAKEYVDVELIILECIVEDLNEKAALRMVLMCLPSL